MNIIVLRHFCENVWYSELFSNAVYKKPVAQIYFNFETMLGGVGSRRFILIKFHTRPFWQGLGVDKYDGPWRGNVFGFVSFFLGGCGQIRWALARGGVGRGNCL